MKKYTPNWRDPRTQRRIKTSLDWALACLSPTKPRSWSTRHIDRVFGNQGNPLSKMMRQCLLITHDPYYNPQTSKCKQYLLNMDGAGTLGSHVGRTITQQTLQAQRTLSADTLYGAQIAQGAFEYVEKSNRLWNDIQNLENNIRKPLFENYGYIHEYDIRSAAPTLLYQLAKSYRSSLELERISQYVEDPNLHRHTLAQRIGCDPKIAKRLITARFAGARFGPQNSIAQELNNRLQYQRLRHDDWFEQLSAELKILWSVIKTSEDLPRLTARNKWSIYFREELRVMRSVHSSLNKQGITYFHEHDGWRSTSAVDLRGLKLHVKKQTGYWIDFD